MAAAAPLPTPSRPFIRPATGPLNHQDARPQTPEPRSGWLSRRPAPGAGAGQPPAVAPVEPSGSGNLRRAAKLGNLHKHDPAPTRWPDNWPSRATGRKVHFPLDPRPGHADL